jgi:adenosine 3'-phospho 5'-phosphosulfate transporter B2
MGVADDDMITEEGHGPGNSNLGDIVNDLCINFLMYVVLIIVFHMLSKYYFEIDSPSYETARSAQNENAREVGDTGKNEVLVDLDEDALEEESLRRESSSEGSPMSKREIDRERSESAELPLSSLRKAGSFLNVSEWGEPEGTKQEVIQKAIFCSLGLHITFCIWGVVQERILTQSYDGEYFTYTYGLVFVNRLGGLLLSFYLLKYFRVKWTPTNLVDLCFPSVSNMLSSWCQYEALQYVSFPAAMLFKAFKIMPTMVMGSLLNNKRYDDYEYAVATTIGLGVYLFISSTDNLSFSINSFGDPEGVTGTWCGVALLLFFLFFDSFTGQWQSRMFERHRDMSSLQMMVLMNAFSSVFSFVTLVHQDELWPTFVFVGKHPLIIGHIVVFTICSTVGQLFIFYTIQKFGAVVFSLIMAIRILLSVMLSCVVYSHPISEMGYLGIIIVFSSIGYRIKRKTEGRPLIRWKEHEDAKEVFTEWHEHVDM